MEYKLRVGKGWLQPDPIRVQTRQGVATSHPPRRIGVIGAEEASPKGLRHAEAVGHLIAEAGALLVCGGLGGIMEAAARGAKEGGGLTVGILPGSSAAAANPFIDIPIPTGLGQARNVLVVQSAEALIAIEGGYGTLSEIAFALKLGIPVVGLDSTYTDARMTRAKDAASAVAHALRLVGPARGE